MDSIGADGVYENAVENAENQITSQVTDVVPNEWDGRERRMNIAAYNYWEGLLADRPFPAVADLDPEALQPFSRNALLIDFTKGYEEPVLRYVGPDLRKESGFHQDDSDPTNVPRGTVLSRLTDHYLEILANRSPVGFEAEFNHRNGVHVMYRGILMPLSDDGENINFIYGVVSWRSDGEISRDVPDAVLALEDTVETDHDLVALLERGRAAAERFNASDQRSRAALYETLDFAHLFACAAQKSPRAYEELLKETGLKVQKRAPFTPIIKLVFGLGHDKTRVAEYATVLAHADRHNVVPGDFQAFVDDFDGGLKAVVAEERRARRGEQAPQRQSELEAAMEAARDIEALGHINLPDCEGDDEFVLIVARRNLIRDGYDIIGRDPCSATQVQHAIRRFTKQFDH